MKNDDGHFSRKFTRTLLKVRSCSKLLLKKNRAFLPKKSYLVSLGPPQWEEAGEEKLAPADDGSQAPVEASHACVCSQLRLASLLFSSVRSCDVLLCKRREEAKNTKTRKNRRRDKTGLSRAAGSVRQQ